MVASADMNHINKLLDRVDDFDESPDVKDLRITFEVWQFAIRYPGYISWANRVLEDRCCYLEIQEFKAFADLRRRLEPFAMAIFSYGKVNGLLTKQDLKRAATHVWSSIIVLIDVVWNT